MEQQKADAQPGNGTVGGAEKTCEIREKRIAFFSRI
jgi:hypothetical protein